MYSEHGLDARSLISQAPSIRFGACPGQYGWIQVDRPTAGLRPEDKVRLTVAGMAKVTKASHEVHAFIETLGLFVDRERRFSPHPTDVQVIEVWSGEIRKYLERRRVIGDDDRLTAIREALGREPSTWHCQTTDSDGGAWTAALSPFLRSYADVSSPTEYVDLLVATIGHPGRPVSDGPAVFNGLDRRSELRQLRRRAITECCGRP